MSSRLLLLVFFPFFSWLLYHFMSVLGPFHDAHFTDRISWVLCLCHMREVDGTLFFMTPLPSCWCHLCGFNGSLRPHVHLCVDSGILKPTNSIFGRLMVDFSFTVESANMIELRGGMSFNCSEIGAGTKAEELVTLHLPPPQVNISHNHGMPIRSKNKTNNPARLQ